MAVKLFLNSQTITNHLFPVMGKNAYNATEVDKFLDIVIQDYRLVESSTLLLTKEYEALKEKNKQLETEKRNLEIEVEKYKAKAASIKFGGNVNTDNIDLIKRIDTLEKFLWAHGYNPDTIKK